MTIRTEGSRVLDRIGTAGGERVHVVNLEVGPEIIPLERCSCGAEFALTAGTFEHERFDKWIPQELAAGSHRPLWHLLTGRPRRR